MICHVQAKIESQRKPDRQICRSIADGISVVKWREENNVSERTAYRWSASAEVRKRVHQLRRDRCDGAVGVMAKHATAAAEEIVNLGKHAKSEAVKLSALRRLVGHDDDVPLLRA